MLNMRNAAIAAIAVASLSLSVMSVAQAQGGKGTPVHRAIYNTTRETPKADAAVHNYPTWPAGEPDYHGSNGGSATIKIDKDLFYVKSLALPGAGDSLNNADGGRAR